MQQLAQVLFLGILIITSSCAGEGKVGKTLPDHPRILFFEGEEAEIMNSLNASPTLKKIHDAILRESDAIRKLDLLTREQEGVRLLAISREGLRRVYFLSYAYRMTGDEIYAQRGKDEMLALAAFDDWNPSHFLDVAEMTMALAIGYDWLYNELDVDSRELIRDAIIEKGLKPSYDTNYNWFLEAAHNWNQVCNAGMVYGALAVYEDVPELANAIIDRAYSTITLPKFDYEPDGAYPEGYGYWHYGTTFNVMFLSAVDRIWPHRFNYDDYSAFLESAGFVKHMIAPSGINFNWGDNNAGSRFSPAMFWFASKKKQASLLWNENKNFLDRDDFSHLTKNRLLPSAILWGHNIAFEEINEPDKKLYVAQGKMPLLLARTSWAEPDARYLGFKGGSPSVNHAHMDVGSFVFEADGVRWAIDLGMQNYHSLESKGLFIWGHQQDAERWRVYRLNNYSHSTLTVNGELQRVDGYAHIERYLDNPDFTFGIADLSSLYSTTLTSVKRGVALLEQDYVLIRDEIATGADIATVRWQMLTGAELQIISDNLAVLKQDEKELFIRVDSPRNAKITRWSTHSETDWDVANPGTQLVGFEVRVPANTNEVLDVKLIPASANTEAQFDKSFVDW